MPHVAMYAVGMW